MPTDKDVKRGEIKATLVGAAAAGLGWGLSTEFQMPPAVEGYLMTAGTLGLVMAGGGIGHAVYRNSRAGQRRKIFRAHGWAGRHDFADVLGSRAIRKMGNQTRPSLVNRADRNGYKPRDTDFGQYLGRAVSGFRPSRGSKVFADWEFSLLYVARPGAGKTALMLHSLLDAPGAVLATSTKPDIYTLTSELRAQRGPVMLFNPQNIGNLGGDFRWDPLIGCENYQMATDRASALVKGTKAITAMQEASWGEKCVEIVKYYLMAARLAGSDLTAVGQWLNTPEDETPIRILRHFTPQYVPDGWAASLEAEMRSPADRMKGSIWSLARAAVAFMANPLIAAACGKGAGESFDARTFAQSGGTLYLLGDKSDETIAPLLSALTDYVYREVKALAQTRPEERLDPPFGFFLDEVTKITPVPLADWAMDARSHGMYITAITQTLDAIRERWGEAALGQIKTLFGYVVLGGIKNPADLKELSDLVGTREVSVESEGETASATGRSRSRNRSRRKEPVMPPEYIQRLPRGHALILLGEAKAVVTRFKKGQIRAEKELEKLRKSREAVPETAEQPENVTNLPQPEPVGAMTSDDGVISLHQRRAV